MNHRSLHLLLVAPESNEPDGPGLAPPDGSDFFDEVTRVGTLQGALERLGEGGIDAVLLFLELPDSRGLETFERTHAFAPAVPIVVVGESDNLDVSVAAVQGGAQDHLDRGRVTPEAVERAVRYGIERHKLLSALQSSSFLDALTGLYNRAGFAELSRQYLSLARRSERGITLLCLDVDHLRTVNEALGHSVGDRVLSTLAETLKARFRGSDLVARIGGDEFVVFALGSSPEGAEILRDRAWSAVADADARLHGVRLSASLGMARVEPGEESSVDELLAAALSDMSGSGHEHRAGVS